MYYKKTNKILLCLPVHSVVGIVAKASCVGHAQTCLCPHDGVGPEAVLVHTIEGSTKGSCDARHIQVGLPRVLESVCDLLCVVGRLIDHYGGIKLLYPLS